MTDAKRLYDEDLVLWAQEQAAALRAAAQGASNLELDWENLAEEIEDLAASQRRRVRSHIMRIIQHLVKIEHSPAIEPRSGWRRTVRIARIQVEKLLRANPSLRPQLGRFVEEETGDAIELAIIDLEEHGEIEEDEESVLRRARYGEEQVLGDWFPPEPARE